jgi:hypothetical protein
MHLYSKLKITKHISLFCGGWLPSIEAKKQF